MGKRVLIAASGALVGLIIGGLCGGYIGMVIGGTFFGWLELPSKPLMPAYELFTYIGIVLGILITTPFGAIVALRLAARAGNKVRN